MIQKILGRISMGFIIGVTLGQITQLVISVLIGDGEFLSTTEEFGSLFSSEVTAVLAQFFLTGCIGVGLALGSFIFDIESWSLLKQYLIHLISTGAVWLPIVILLWMPQSIIGVIILLANFIGAYLITYWIQYVKSKKDIEEINAVLQQAKGGV